MKAKQIIVKVTPLRCSKIQIETNSGKRYTSNLEEFKKVFCFPKTKRDWENVSITTGGYSLTWSTRFEVHVDQVIDAAMKVEKLKLTQAG